MTTRRQFFGTLGTALGAAAYSSHGPAKAPSHFRTISARRRSCRGRPHRCRSLPSPCNCAKSNGRSMPSRAIATSTEASQAQEHLGTKQ
jgi:hypothetical protein